MNLIVQLILKKYLQKNMIGQMIGLRQDPYVLALVDIVI